MLAICNHFVNYPERVVPVEVIAILRVQSVIATSFFGFVDCLDERVRGSCELVNALEVIIYVVFKHTCSFAHCKFLMGTLFFGCFPFDLLKLILINFNVSKFSVCTLEKILPILLSRDFSCFIVFKVPVQVAKEVVSAEECGYLINVFLIIFWFLIILHVARFKRV